MLCEGTPLLLYTPWGLVTPLGMHQGALRVGQCPVANRSPTGGGLPYSSFLIGISSWAPLLSTPRRGAHSYIMAVV